MKSLLLITLFFFLSLTVNAQQNNLIPQITDAVTNICNRPADAGKYWDVAVEGSGDAKVKLLLARGSVTGDVKFSSGEWENTLNTIENTKDYRECAQRLTPIFINKFTGAVEVEKKNSNSRKVGGVTWSDNHNDIRAELKRCEKNGTNMVCHYVLQAMKVDIAVELYCEKRLCLSFDQEGNAFDPFKVKIANQSSEKRLRFHLIQGVPTKAEIHYGVYSTSKIIKKIGFHMNSANYAYRDMDITL